jgi:chemotaxis protein CheC
VKTLQLSSSDLDGLREVSNIGAGNAAGALSQLIGETVSLEIPVVRALQLQEVPTALGGAEQPVVALRLGIRGGVRGNLLIVMSPAEALHVLHRMGVQAVELDPSEPMLASALRELGNILGSTYLTAVSQLVHSSLVPSVPGLAVDMAGAVVDLLLMEIGGASDHAMVLETSFREKNGPIRGEFFLLPDPASLPHLVQSIRGLT